MCTSTKFAKYCTLVYHRLGLNSAGEPEHHITGSRKVLKCRKWHCTYTMPRRILQPQSGKLHDYAPSGEKKSPKVLQAFESFQSKLLFKVKPSVPRPCSFFRLLFSLGQTTVVVVVAVGVNVARPPVHPLV